MTKQIPQHSSSTPEHFTPTAITVAAAATMLAIDLDPATTALANSKRVHASTFFTKEDDGLSKAWFGRVWLNPPGGRIKNRSSAALWWSKLADEYSAGRVKQAVFLGFTLEILATTQEAKIWPGSLPFCVPRHRIEFLQEVDGEFVLGESPTHSNVIAYLPPVTCDRKIYVERFATLFSPFGKIRV